MKKDLISLIDSVDNIGRLFHPVGGNGMPTVNTIYDVQEFQDWLQEVHLELRDIHDRTKDHFVCRLIRRGKCFKSLMPDISILK